MSAPINTAFEVENLSKRYGKTLALSDVSMTAPSGGVTAILGQNGAGKTTFINILLGLAQPSGGRALVLGAAPGDLGARRRTGAMLQTAELPDLLTVREHVELFSSYYPSPRPVQETLGLAGLEAFAGKLYRHLSGGQKRRTQFALAVAGRPHLVFLDEPTTGLDTESRRGLWTVVRNLASEGVTVILTTHYLEEADALADRVVVFHEGRIVADAPTAQFRDRVGGSIIRCVTRLSAEVLTALPAARAARAAGRLMETLTANPTATLKALFEADPDVSDLTVNRASLEDAFLEVTNNGERSAA